MLDAAAPPGSQLTRRDQIPHSCLHLLLMPLVIRYVHLHPYTLHPKP